jgi:hypothetical protein
VFEVSIQESPESFDSLESLGVAMMREYAAKHVPEGHALKFGPEDPVPREVYFPAVLRMPFGIFGRDATLLLHFFQWICPIARASNSEFFLEEKYMDCARSPWEPKHTIELLQSRRRHEGIANRPLATPKAPQKPERNAPCPCGSQKKYKRCCALKTEGDEESREATN